ncbi:MAG: adenylosuccinate lyase [Flavobacteriales bacterium]
MDLTPLTATTPIDGRYQSKTSSLSHYFSEYALIKYRVHVEVEYFIKLSETGLKQFPELSDESKVSLRNAVTDFSLADAEEVKTTERTTNHDVKAVEYFLKKRVDDLGLEAVREFVHFGLTSQDINNTAIPLSLMEGIGDTVIPLLADIIEALNAKAAEWMYIPMLAKTHGQPASPTTLGKEIYVFSERLQLQVAQLKELPFSAKFGGATGNLNAHKVTFPDTPWVEWANDFVENNLGLTRSQTTTQIEHYDNLAALFDCMKRINTILIDFNRDVWTYVSMDYFKQKIKEGEVGSSAMPHKVNPIDFENSEGNLGLANAILEHLSAKLPISRLQRDLTDSTVLRNVGVPLGHMLIAYTSTLKGMDKLLLNKASLERDLDNNWAVCAEAIQNILRREHFPNPYEALKDLTRKNDKITQASLIEFINELDITEKVKEELKKITPHNYTGYLPEIK